MSFFFFFNDTATTEIYTLSLHDALPISWPRPCSFSPPTSRATLRGRCWSSTVAWCCDPIPSPPLRNAMAMDMKQLEEKVKDIIVEELGVERDKLTSDASFMEDLGADSLDTVELVMAFEKEFDIDIPDEEAEKLRTVGQALQYLHEKMGK